MVRTTQGSVNRYSAGVVPTSTELLVDFLRGELSRIESAMNEIADGQLDVTTVAPTKPRDGMIRRANGTSWSPGGLGAGVYCYYAGNWAKLG